MELSSVFNLVNLIVHGGMNATLALLILIIVALVWDRRRLVSEIAKKDQKIDRIVDDYYKGNLTLSEALNSLKAVLFEIKGKL